ncbi:MAG TPA: M4 family metallopeptidase [Candidatus Saccharimonadales bacterium]|jgi:Zn-dependent metalloprotease|nr:M4 family metallopeptidase [Candidatus Saccharimonadales bacterium]
MCDHPRVCYIIPPHILRHLTDSARGDLKAKMQQNMILSHGLRVRRSTFAEIGLAAQSIGELNRTIYDAQNAEDVHGALVRSEGDDAIGDPSVNEAYDAAGTTYDFYHEVFKRNSIDNKGMRLDSVVHYGDSFDNAFWDGREMVYGDGDGRIFNRFTLDLDVIAHELTHGVTAYEADLAYSGQPGALNESMSDVFGSLVKQWKLQQSAKDADWLIGADLLAAGVNGKALRSMSEPGTAYNDPKLGGRDPQPAHMRDYQEMTRDHGGVHINSGIPNRAFYLAATKIDPTGFAWEKAGKIWYMTLTTRLSTNSTFQDCANATYLVAGEQFGQNGQEQQAVAAAWSDVGIDVDQPAAPRGLQAVAARRKPSNPTNTVRPKKPSRAQSAKTTKPVKPAKKPKRRR